MHVLLLAGNIFALTTEMLAMGSVAWSALSVYLSLVSIALYSILTRYDSLEGIRALLLGGAFGASVTLALTLTPFSDELYRYGIRFTGFFKDPNVTAPTALFFAVALLGLRGRQKWWAVAPFLVFAISISRATYLAAAVGVIYLIAVRNKLAAFFIAAAVLVAALFAESLLKLADTFFQSIGRQGLINSYDGDRSSNWADLLDIYMRTGVPLGPSYSETNGMSAHSTYVRLLVEQGPVVLIMFVLAVLITWRSCSSVYLKAGLLCILVNGVVIDATHWRVLFIAIALCLAWTAEPTTDVLASEGSRGRRRRAMWRR